jgi:glycosyltransferase involved in cell wall biosynthesis
MRGILTVGVAARSLGIPVMTWDKLDKPHGWLDWLELPLLHRTAVISNAVLTKFPQWQVRWFRKRIEHVSNGADLVRFDTVQSMRSSLGFEDQDIVIGIVGTVCDRKGHDRVLSVLPQILKRVPQAIVVVVGSWDDDIEHQRFYEYLPYRDHPRVQFLGARSPEEMPGIMKSLDLLAVPSRHEGMGQVVAEAMACRIPVAGARAGGIPEIVVDGETGLLFDGDDPASIQEAIITLCESSELRIRMGEAGRARVEKHFNRPQQMQRICELFRELLK